MKWVKFLLLYTGNNGTSLPEMKFLDPELLQILHIRIKNYTYVTSN